MLLLDLSTHSIQLPCDALYYISILQMRKLKFAKVTNWRSNNLEVENFYLILFQKMTFIYFKFSKMLVLIFLKKIVFYILLSTPHIAVREVVKLEDGWNHTPV